MSMIMSKKISIQLDGKRVKVPEGITVKRVLEISGCKVTKSLQAKGLRP